MILRIFGMNLNEVKPSELAQHLHDAGLPVEPHFRGDDLGWTGGTLILPGEGAPIQLERYLTKEDDLREELNTFAAELETMDYNPNHERLMREVIQTQQLFALRRPLDHSNEALLDRLLTTVAQYLAKATDGFYQMDGEGWFAADGQVLLPEY
ncbi:MAG: hypothetical protein ACRC8S_07215 [Fimbriiglobus sp.]